MPHAIILIILMHIILFSRNNCVLYIAKPLVVLQDQISMFVKVNLLLMVLHIFNCFWTQKS